MKRIILLLAFLSQSCFATVFKTKESEKVFDQFAFLPNGMLIVCTNIVKDECENWSYILDIAPACMRPSYIDIQYIENDTKLRIVYETLTKCGE
jgi:hypothetical protein